MVLLKRDCLNCGVAFERSVYGRKLQPGARPPMFCSSKCAAQAQWQGHTATQRQMVRDKSHPLAGKTGRMFVYRKVLYDAIGEGPHPCHWCGTPVEWRTDGLRVGALVADHLDGDHTNNTAENLVPACQNCNVLRGMVWSWEDRTGSDISRLKGAS